MSKSKSLANILAALPDPDSLLGKYAHYDTLHLAFPAFRELPPKCDQPPPSVA